MQTPVVRSFLDALRIDGAAAPFDTVQLRVFYPATYSGSAGEMQTGILPADTALAPFPVIVFLQGVNIPAFTYFWLARVLAESGRVVVVPEWPAQNLKGRTSFTPGIDLSALPPAVLGSRPSSSVLPALVKHMQTWQAEGVLAGHIDLHRIIIGGHSAGGSMALLNARKDWLPGIIGAFGVCSNLLATFALGGWERGKLAPLPADVPMLLIGGTRDGIAVHHNQDFGHPGESPTDITIRTLRESVQRNQLDAYAVILQGANHHSVCDPVDESIGRTFLDSPTPADEAAIRSALALCIDTFVTCLCSGRAKDFVQALNQTSRAGSILDAETKTLHPNDCAFPRLARESTIVRVQVIVTDHIVTK